MHKIKKIFGAKDKRACPLCPEIANQSLDGDLSQCNKIPDCSSKFRAT